jgi:hypothetical protein
MTQICENRVINIEYTLTIGCSPGIIRPHNILENILSNNIISNLSPGDFNITCKSFGDWTFAIYDDKTKEYLNNINNIIELLKKEHKNGNIRYADWNYA